MKKRMIYMLAFMGILLGGVFVFHLLKFFIVNQYMKGGPPPVTVSAMKAVSEPWQSSLLAVGSLRAMNDIDVTTEVGGLVTQVVFAPGRAIQKGEIMVELNADVEKAQLKSFEAIAALAEITYKRDQEQYAVKGVSQAVLDSDLANLKSARAQVEQQAAIVEKKTIRAPFTGRVGISEVNLGQYLNPGDKIAPLQSLDPIYVDFFLPQQNLPKLERGQIVTVKTDAYPHASFKGEITSLNSKVDSNTRNVKVEATFANPDDKLIPGMYAEVTVNIGAPKEFITVPQTAISYNPYGNIVYLLEEKGKDPEGKPLFLAHQKFVSLGEARGDQVQVLEGVRQGDLFVTSGQLKLRNGSLVTINNSVVPPNSPHPHPKNEKG